MVYLTLFNNYRLLHFHTDAYSASSLFQFSCSTYVGEHSGEPFSMEQHYTSQPSHIASMTFYLQKKVSTT